MPDEQTTDIQTNILDQQNDTAADSSTDTNKTDVSDSSTDDKARDDKEQLPFNEHPRWKELLEKDKQRDAELADLRSFKEQAEPLISKFQPKEEVNIPSWFGGDENAWKDFSGYVSSLKGEAKAEAIKEIKAEQDAQEKRSKDAEKYLKDSFTELEKETGQTVDRNKVMKFIADLADQGTYLVDKQNRWAIKQAYNLMPKEAPDTSSLDAKRKAASATISESKAESAAPDYKVPRFMRRGR